MYLYILHKIYSFNVVIHSNNNWGLGKNYELIINKIL